MSKIELFTDIETLPTADPEIIKMLTANVEPPKNMSKPETIAKWMEEEKPQVVADIISKTGLDGTYGRICCIGYAFNGEDVKTLIDRDEKKIITQFFSDVQLAGSMPRVIGHSVVGFDLKFLWKRAVINGIKPSPMIDWQSKPWGDYVYDTMVQWDSAPDKRISLHKLCKVLGIESPKDMHGMDGGQIAALWAKREYSKIAKYCTSDVEQMRLCYRKMTL